MKESPIKIWRKKSRLSLTLSAMALASMFMFSACGDDEDGNVSDPCENTDLAVSATAGEASIEAVGSGGTAPYEYAIDGATFQTSGSFTDLDIEEYTVTVQDADGCTATATATPLAPETCETSGLAVAAVAEAYSIEATGEGGTAPYQYSIDGVNFQDEGTFDDLDSTDYTVTIKDSNECTSIVEVAKEDLMTFTDARDGYVYEVLKMGSQIWLGENFKYAPQADTVSSCYEDLAENCAAYGRLYDWDAAQIVAPEGWHLPDSTEWNVLIEELGGAEVAGTEIMEGDFGAQLTGYKDVNGNYERLGVVGGYWTSDENTSDGDGFYYYFEEGVDEILLLDVNKTFNLTVRLVKD